MPQKRKAVKRPTKKTARTERLRTAPVARSGRKSIKSGTRKAKPGTRKPTPSKKSAEPRKRPQIDALSDIELEASGTELTNEVPSAPGSDFEGLSHAEDVDSESVDELVEEGNVFEYGAVAGVEKADDRDGKEVRTRQLLEDDVPHEYDNMD